ncbi:MAG: TusE/DsrC/DsvC family sulfur relay protein [Gammaproteobacteria bacterium]|nr:TusE/DsrC/DsvC family sulfur relay protein [Gammaproteobacteria bacterium]
MQTSKQILVEASAAPASGYLVELDDWSENLAHTLAVEENIKLSDEHLDILNYLRKYYDKHGQGYNARTLLNVMEFEFGKWQGKKRLYELFPKGPVSQGCKLAGIPLPPNCNDPSFGSAH